MTVSASSDLYSVGVVLYEMLTGHVPFDAESAVTIALKHVSQAPTPPSAINPRVPAELEQIVLWVLNKDPVHRPADADQLIEALGQAREAIVASGGGQRTADMPALAVASGLAATDPPTTAMPAAPSTGEDTDGHGDAVGFGTAAGIAAAAYAGAAAAEPAGHTGTVPPTDPASYYYYYGGPGAGAPPPEQQRRNWWPLVTVMLILLLAGAGVAAYLLTRPVKHVVPLMVGEQVSTAQTVLQNAGFTPNLIYRNDAQPKNIVVDQSPLAGAKAEVGSTVTLTVSNGPGPVTVPSIASLPKGAALAEIRAAGLKVGTVVTQASSTVPADMAINTDPASGTQLVAGTNVTVFISSGPAPVNAPSVVGYTVADASNVLTSAGFAVNTITQTSTTAPPNTVISQSATGKVPPGSTITLVVAAAPTTATVPSVTGALVRSAEATLTGAGFKVSQSTKVVALPSDNGVVLSQSPSAGSTAPKGSTVSLVVGQYTAPTHTTTTPTTTTPTTTTPAPTTTTTTPAG
jgi:serine/threonine-protein kinase